MKGIWNWTKEKIFTITTTVAEAAFTTFDNVATVSSTVYNYAADFTANVVFVAQNLFFVPYVSDFIYEVFYQGIWAGRNYLNPVMVKTIYQPEVRKLILNSISINATILLWVTLQQAIDETVDSDEKSALESIRNLYMTSVVNNLLWLFMQRIKFHHYLDKTANLMSITHKVASENPYNEAFPADNEAFISMIKGYIDLPVNLVARVIFVSTCEYFLGRYAIPIRALHEGQTLISYKLDSAGMLPQQQQDLLKSNKIYCTAWGMMLILSARYASNCMMKDNEDVYSAVFNLLYPLFVIASLTAMHPLPHKEGGWDIFHPATVSLKWTIKQISRFIKYCLGSEKEGQTLAMLSHAVTHVPPPVKALFLDRNLHSFEEAATRPHINTLITLRGKEWQNAIVRMKQINGLPFASNIPKITRFLPDVFHLGVIHTFASIVFHKSVKRTLRRVDTIIVHGLKHANIVARESLSSKYKDENLFKRTRNPNALDSGWHDATNSIEEEDSAHPLDETVVKTEPSVACLSAMKTANLIEEYESEKEVSSSEKDEAGSILTDWTSISPMTAVNLVENYEPEKKVVSSEKNEANSILTNGASLSARKPFKLLEDYEPKKEVPSNEKDEADSLLTDWTNLSDEVDAPIHFNAKHKNKANKPAAPHSNTCLARNNLFSGKQTLMPLKREESKTPAHIRTGLI